MTQIKVRIVKSSRDGYLLKWQDPDSTKEPQKKCRGKTQRARETERRKRQEELNDTFAESTWKAFWVEFESSHLNSRSKSYRSQCLMMHKRVQAVASSRGISNLRCTDIDRVLILSVQAMVQGSDVEHATVDNAMRTLWAMVSWGQDVGLIPEFRRPRKRRGKIEKQVQKSKGRSLSGEEIDRIEKAIPLCVKPFEQSAEFTAALHVMRLIGMRLTECWLFSWEPMQGTHFPILLDTSSAAIEFSDIQKSGVDCTVPLTNDAVVWLRQLRDQRLQVPDPSPWVCRTVGQRGEHKTPSRLGRVISDAGRMARVVVKRFQKQSGEKIKFASAHDLRRTFATNLQRDLTISERQRMTRHADAQTLLNHYADAPTPVLIAKLRGG